MRGIFPCRTALRRRATAVIVLHAVVRGIVQEDRVFRRHRWGLTWTETVDYYLVGHNLADIKKILRSLARGSEVIFSSHAAFALSDLLSADDTRLTVHPREHLRALLEALRDAPALARVHLDASLNGDAAWTREMCIEVLGSQRILESDELVPVRGKEWACVPFRAIAFAVSRLFHTIV